MIIKFKMLSVYDMGEHVDTFMTQQGFEEENRGILAEIYDLPEGSKASFTPEYSVFACQEPGQEELSKTEEVREKDKAICRALEYALNDLKDPLSSLHKDLYCQYYPEEKTKETFVEFGMRLIDNILSVYGLKKAIANYYGGKKAANVTATIFEGKKALNSFVFFPGEDMWKDSKIGFEKNEKYIYPVLEGKTMQDFDKEFVLKEIVPQFYASLEAKENAPVRTHDLFDYQMECKDVTGKNWFRKLMGKRF